MDLGSSRAASPNADSVIPNLFKKIASSSPDSIVSIIARTYQGTPDDDDVRSVLAHDLAQQIIEASRGTPGPLDSEAGWSPKMSKVCVVLES